MQTVPRGQQSQGESRSREDMWPAINAHDYVFQGCARITVLYAVWYSVVTFYTLHYCTIL